MALQDLRQPSQDCARCGQALRIIPSCNYAAADVELFDELNETVAVSLAPVAAHKLAVEVDKALASRTFAEAFDALVRRWPGLVPLRLSIGGNKVRQQLVLQILKTIFEAVAISRCSGTMRSVDSEQLDAVRASRRGRAS